MRGTIASVAPMGFDPVYPTRVIEPLDQNRQQIHVEGIEHERNVKDEKLMDLVPRPRGRVRDPQTELNVLHHGFRPQTSSEKLLVPRFWVCRPKYTKVRGDDIMRPHADEPQDLSVPSQLRQLLTEVSESKSS